MFSYCSEDCKDITSLLTDYIYNRVSKEDVKKIIDTKDTSRHMNYKGSYGKAYKEIMGETDSENKIEDSIKNEEIKKDIVKDMANDTVSNFKSNLQSESKKVYPKAIAHKHGK